MIVKIGEGEPAGDGAIGVTSRTTLVVGMELTVAVPDVAATVAAGATGVAGCTVVIVVCVAVAG